MLHQFLPWDGVFRAVPPAVFHRGGPGGAGGAGALPNRKHPWPLGADRTGSSAPAAPRRWTLLSHWERVEAALTAARGASFAYLSAALENRPYAPEKQTEQGAASVPRLADRSRCTGCTACAAGCPKNAIRMVRDRTGFDFPEVDLNQCVHCGRCTSICPLLHERGPAHLPAAFAAWNRDAAVRRRSTSGGAYYRYCGLCAGGRRRGIRRGAGRTAAFAARCLLPQGGPVAAAGGQICPERSFRCVPGR